MSYQTNPIIVRLGISQGWYQGYFPLLKTDYLNYFIFNFKMYIYIKFQLKRMNMEIINFELKTDNTGILMLYLNIQKQYRQRFSIKGRSRLLQNSYRRSKKYAKYTGFFTYQRTFRYLKLKKKRNKKGSISKQISKQKGFALKKRDIKNLTLRC